MCSTDVMNRPVQGVEKLLMIVKPHEGVFANQHLILDIMKHISSVTDSIR